MKYPVAVTVNGRLYRKEVEARTLLVDFLRNDLGLTGSHVACETSQCGACIVELDGRTLKACTRLAVQVDGAEITTIEGIAGEDDLHAIQTALVEENATRCGFCLPGVVLGAREFLDRSPETGEVDICRAIEGVLCRCMAYDRLVESVRLTAEKLVHETLEGGAAGS